MFNKPASQCAFKRGLSSSQKVCCHIKAHLILCYVGTFIKKTWQNKRRRSMNRSCPCFLQVLNTFNFLKTGKKFLQYVAMPRLYHLYFFLKLCFRTSLSTRWQRTFPVTRWRRRAICYREERERPHSPLRSECSRRRENPIPTDQA